MTPASTPRLHFRHWTPHDLPLATQLWGDLEVTRYIGGPFSSDWITDRLDTEAQHLREHGIQYWPIFLTADNTFVGCAGLRPYDPVGQAPDPHIYEVGAHLRPPFWGGGFAHETALAVIDHAFNHLHAAALFAGHHPENHGSRKLLAKLAFTPTGTQLYIPTGLQHPTYLLRKPVP